MYRIVGQDVSSKCTEHLTERHHEIICFCKGSLICATFYCTISCEE